MKIANITITQNKAIKYFLLPTPLLVDILKRDDLKIQFNREKLVKHNNMYNIQTKGQISDSAKSL